MEMIEDLDPEETWTVLDPALGLMVVAVHHTVTVTSLSPQATASLRGSGAPVAHENQRIRSTHRSQRQ
jgi:hypothetical protein